MSGIVYITGWDELIWFSTGGTRDKKYLNNPETGKKYFFKESAQKYPYEFWSELIAYQLGQMLGFNVLKYEVAINGRTIGCISESMLDSDQKVLVEIGKLMQRYNPEFSAETKSGRKEYTFQLLERTFQSQRLGVALERIFEVLVFDTIIGNGDRHQENWAFIDSTAHIEKLFERANELVQSLPPNRSFKSLFSNPRNMKSLFKPKPRPIDFKNLPENLFLEFSPIYDSGSSLARECTSEKIEALLQDDVRFKAYINRGESELHWNGKKISHFHLLHELQQDPLYAPLIRDIINRVLEKFNKSEFEMIIQAIDDGVPQDFDNVKLPEPRKKLLIKLVSLRIEKLREYLQ